VAAGLVADIALAQSSQIEGLIIGRSGATMTLQTQDAAKVVVLLSDNTQVIEPGGVFRSKHLPLTAVIPGLPVKVKGSYNPQNQLLADSAEFKCSSLQGYSASVPSALKMSPLSYTSQQVAPDKTAEGQAENRRVMVKILQNKGIAGTQSAVLLTRF
jgi:hypothetical protein